MTDIITYTPEFIFKYKSSNILTDSLILTEIASWFLRISSTSISQFSTLNCGIFLIAL